MPAAPTGDDRQAVLLSRAAATSTVLGSLQTRLDHLSAAASEYYARIVLDHFQGCCRVLSSGHDFSRAGTSDLRGEGLQPLRTDPQPFDFAHGPEPVEGRLRPAGWPDCFGMAEPELFMHLSSHRERSFFLAQAFTPGNRESNGFSAPFRGLVLRRAEKPPGRGLHSV